MPRIAASCWKPTLGIKVDFPNCYQLRRMLRMKISVSRKFCLLLLVLLAGGRTGHAQLMSIDTREIESVIDEWMFANNGRNLESFRRVYADELLFYTQKVSEKRAIELKQQLFQLKPYFTQRIITPITYTPYTSGVIKCEFTREVFEKNYWKKYPSYLLVSYEGSEYRIVGESDVATDRVLKYSLEIGEPMTFEDRATLVDTTTADSTELASASGRVLDSVKSFLSIDQINTVLPDMSAMGVVTVPKGYIYVLIGILTIGGLMIFIADSAQSRKRVRRGTAMTKNDEAERVVRDFKMQSVFESFVITLFDPLYFQYKRPKQQRVYAGNPQASQPAPDLIFEFRQKETEVRFAILCRYYKHIAKNEVQIMSLEFRRGLLKYESDLDLYYVLGFGGTPDDPKELYFIPAAEVDSDYITKASLRQYSKSGMFYYNRRTGRIQ